MSEYCLVLVKDSYLFSTKIVRDYCHVVTIQLEQNLLKTIVSSISSTIEITNLVFLSVPWPQRAWFKHR